MARGVNDRSGDKEDRRSEHLTDVAVDDWMSPFHRTTRHGRSLRAYRSLRDTSQHDRADQRAPATTRRIGARLLQSRLRRGPARGRARDAFEVVVGGVQIARLGLPGKPDPSAFLEPAARRLCVSPPSAFVVEDAMVGVQAARAAGFGLVIGLAHKNPDSIRADLGRAADVVAASLTSSM